MISIVIILSLFFIRKLIDWRMSIIDYDINYTYGG